MRGVPNVRYWPKAIIQVRKYALELRSNDRKSPEVVGGDHLFGSDLHNFVAGQIGTLV